MGQTLVKRRLRDAVIALAAGVSLIAVEPAARACGAAAVSKGSIAVSAQRIFLSVRGGKTEIVVQLVVPKSPADYGALIPLPGQPTLDAQPVDSDELDELDRATQIDIVRPSSGGIGCGCGSAAEGKGAGGVLVETVNIGPVTAATLRGDSGAAVNDWLSQNGFVIAAEQRSLVDAYSGAGRTFVAVKRNGAVTDAPDSLGIHLTLDGDQRGLPLRFTRIGADTKLAFTIFVASAQAAGPSPPYTALLVTQLDRQRAFASYGDAVAQAVDARGSLAFVAEYRAPVSPKTSFLGMRLQTLVDDGQTLTRYSTVIASASINADADFYGAAPASVPTVISARATAARRFAGIPVGSLLLALAGLAAARALARRRSR